MDTNAAILTLRPVDSLGQLDHIIGTYSWVSGPMAGLYDAVNFADWQTAFSAIGRQSEVIRRVSIVGLTPGRYTACYGYRGRRSTR